MGKVPRFESFLLLVANQFASYLYEEHGKILIVCCTISLCDSLVIMASSYEFVTVDVFTTKRYLGNPLAIINVPTGSTLDQTQKQTIAGEFNLSETVFLHEEDPSQDGRQLDIFTPSLELNWAGHPTIGTLCYIGQLAGAIEGSDRSIKLRTKAGIVNARYNHHAQLAIAEIPHNVHIHATTVHPSTILKTQPQLESALQHVLKSGTSSPSIYEEIPIVSIVKGASFLLIRLPSVSDYLEKLSLHPAPVAPASDSVLDKGWTPSFLGLYFYVILQDSEHGVTKGRSRMIEPEILEDPATGAAACALSSYLALQAGGNEATSAYEIEQGVEMGRRSLIKTQVTLDGTGKAIKQVTIAGSAVLVTQGTIHV